MGVIRNFIEIVGIASEEDLPEKPLGQLVKYDEAEHIFIPEDKSAIKDIYQISIGIDIKSNRIIKTNDCKTVSIDGFKKLKIVYSQEESPNKMVMLNLQLPYNTFFEMPKEAGDIDSLSIYVLDAYFSLMDKRRIYGHFLYLLNVRHSMPGMEKPAKKKAKNIEVISINEISDNNVPQIALSHEDFVITGKNTAKRSEAPQQDNEDKESFNEDIGCLYL